MDKPPEEKPLIYIPQEGELQDLEGLGELKGSVLFQPGERVMADDHLLVINAKPFQISKSTRIEQVPYQFTGLFVERLTEPGVNDDKVSKMLRQHDSVRAQFGVGDPFYMHALTDIGQNGRRAIIATYLPNGVQENDAGSLHLYERCVFINGVGILLHQVAITNPRINIEQQLLSLDQQLLEGSIDVRKVLGLEEITEEEQKEPDDGGVALREFEEAYCAKPSGIYSRTGLFTHQQILEIINRFKKALLN